MTRRETIRTITEAYDGDLWAAWRDLALSMAVGLALSLGGVAGLNWLAGVT